jgi:hypothetical protein
MLKDQASRLDALVRHFALADATVSVKADGLAAAAAASAAAAAATRAPEDGNTGGGAEAALRSDWRLIARAS